MSTNANDFLAAMKNRRSIYGLDPKVNVSDNRIEEMIGQAVLHTPSAFNSQTSRVILLLGANHQKLWDITTEVLRGMVPAENFASTEEKMNSFRQGHGTVLFFEDQAVIEGFQNQFSAYADNFPIWSNQTSGMLQHAVWVALELEGLGASLQHYNPIIDDQVREAFDVPASWKLIAQMPFGTPTQTPGEKQFEPLEKRLVVKK